MFGMEQKNCKKCDQILTGKQSSYCSKRCSKLHLKALYKKRNRIKVNEYNNRWRRQGQVAKWPAKLRGSECLKCGSSDDLQLAHIKPHWAGGKLDTTATFCRQHHAEFDRLLREWWTT